MITDEEFTRRIDDISESFSFTVLYTPTQQDKTLDKIVIIVKNATKKQLLSRHPHALVTCLLRLLLYYENVLHMDGFCEWKRRRKFRIARDCYHALLKSYLPEKSWEVVETIVEAIYHERLWKFETFCFEVLYSLLDVNPVIAGLIIHAVWNKLTLPDISIEDARGIIRILYELLDVYVWPATQDTVMTIEKILGLFHASIIARLMIISDSSSVPSPSPALASLKKGLEVCLRNTMKHLPNDQLLVVVHHLCSWTVAADTTDEFVLEFGSTLEFAAYTHQADLYEQTLTPTIFPLLMRMVGSTSRLTSLLGNRVLQYLMDRKDNRAIFDTPRIFFEHTRLDLHVTHCRKEDRLFFKLHRELLHDSLLKSLINHSDSRMNLETTYCTICLIAVEVPCGFMAAALVCLTMNLQEIILQQQDYRVEVACHMHAMIISIMSLICWIHKAKVFYSYVNRIVIERAQWAPHLNPPIQSQYNFALHHVLWKPELFFVDWEVRYGLWKCFRLTDSHNNITLIEQCLTNQFSLVWNSFPRNLSSGLYTLLTDEHLVDVTLAAEGQILRAHKLILSVCSTYFRELFKGNSCKHPIVILKDVNYRDLSAMLHFMYQGEVNIKQEDIASFLKVAEALQIKGLTTNSDERFKETFKKNDEDFEDRGFYEVERDKCDPGGTDENVSAFGRLTHIVKEQSTTRQSTSTEDILTTERPFTVQTSTDTWQGCTEADYSVPDARIAFNERSRSTDMPCGMEEQPLDCTSDVSQPQSAKLEPLDYTMDMDTDARYRYAAEKILYAGNENASKQDFAPDTQLVPYNQNSQTQPFGLSDTATYPSDFTYETTNSSNKGRRTVKGIPGSSLPLETTLRVVSELGPTLRMEHGKVIRMYACPWCLRQFTRKENLKLHVRYIHGPLESLTCKLCGNKYKNSNSLRVHSYLYHNAKRDKSSKSLAAGDDGISIDGDGGTGDSGGDGV